MPNSKGGGEVVMSALDLYHPSATKVSDTKKTKDFLDLLNVYAQLTIYDSILTPFQSAELLINDSNDMVPDYPIIGGNIVHIKYNVADGPKDNEINMYFRVTKVKNVVITERKQAFTLNLVSEAGWQNMYTSLSTPFVGSPSQIVKSTFDKYIYEPSETGKKIAIDGTIGNLKLVAPRWKPSQVIKWVSDKALDVEKDMPGFFFFETNHGFRFMSLTTMLDKTKNIVITDLMGDITTARKEGSPPKGYLYKVPGVPVYGSDGKPLSGMVGSETTQNVDDFRASDRSRIGEDVIAGDIASKHITHDIFHKSIDTQTFNYWDDFDKSTRLSKIPQYYQNNIPISADIKVNLSPKQSKIHSNTKDQPGDRTLYADDYGLMRKHLMKQINDVVINNFEVPGNPVIESGRLVEFNYPSIRKVEKPEDAYQKKYSGFYLIRDCIHMFTPVGNQTTQYKVDMNIVKDGFHA